MSKKKLKDMINDYSSDKIEVIESDIEKLKKRPGMYIGYIGWKGFFHISKEVIQNSIDEGTNDDSPCDRVSVIYDAIDKRVTVIDNGRGIPPEKVVDICTKLNSSGKFDLGSYSNDTAGENGVGITATNALSKSFKVIVYRLKYKYTFEFEYGVLKNEKKEKSEDANKHGTVITFVPDEGILGKCNMTYKPLLNWLEIMQYSCRGLRLDFTSNDGAKNINKSFYSENGIYDIYANDKKLKNKMFFDPIYIEDKGEITSDKYSKSAKAINGALGFRIEAVVGIDKTETAENIDSFCNFVNTVDGGEHVTGVRKGVGEYILNLVKKKMSKKDLEKLNPQIEDTRIGLYLLVNLFTKEPNFVGQTKEKVGNRDLTHPISKLIYEALEEKIGKNKTIVDMLVKIVRTNADQRLKNKRAREASLKDIGTASSNFDLPDKLTPVSDKYKEFIGQYELFICEGDSAGSNAEDGVDSRFQAIYSIKGVPPNGFKMDIVKAMRKEVFKDIAKVLGCGIGDNFDIKKLKYKKIVILTDADSDGDNIASLLLAFFIMHMPELVENGHLYRAFPPLLEVSIGGKSEYVRDRIEYAELVLDSVSSKLELAKDGKMLTKKDIKYLISRNIDYIYELDKLADTQEVHSDIVERLLVELVNNSKPKTLKKHIESYFSEISVDISNTESIQIEGVYDGDYQYLVNDLPFQIMASDMLNIINTINDCEILYKYNGNVCTLGMILRDLGKHAPKILGRFKGLGAMGYKSLRDTTLLGTKSHPRRLIQLTVKDMEEAIDSFNVIHGPNSDKAAMDIRRKLMENFTLNRDEIDN